MGNSTPSSIIFQDSKWQLKQLVTPTEAFRQLPLERRLFVYHLAEAMDAGRDIIWMQLNPNGILLRDFLLAAAPFTNSWPAGARKSYLEYFARVFARHGNYDENSNSKMLPEGIGESLFAEIAHHAGYQDQWPLLREVIFDTAKKPNFTSLTDDAIAGSSSGFYGEGVSEAAMNKLPHEERNHFLSYAKLNSNGEVTIVPYGTHGHFQGPLRLIDKQLKKAIEFATPKEAEILELIRQAITTGNPSLLAKSDRLWAQHKPKDIDFIFGFVEVYADPLAVRGTFEGNIFLLSRSNEDLQRLQALEKNVDYFESQMPVDPRFKKAPGFVPPSAEGAYVIHNAGSAEGHPFMGVNLPNDPRIRAEFGSKSYGSLNTMFTIGEPKAVGTDEFYMPEYRPWLQNTDLYLLDVMQVEMHEILGHGSGQLLPGVDPSSVGEYHSPLEETRAEVASLYQLLDPQLRSLGILPSTLTDEEVQNFQKLAVVRFFTKHIDRYQRLADSTQSVKQAHTWARQAMLNKLLHMNILQIETGSDAIPRIRLQADLAQTRAALGTIWAEVQLATSTGDLHLAKNFLEEWGQYGEFHKTIRSQIVTAKTRLGIPYENIYLNPRLELELDQNGKAIDVRIQHFEQQQDLSLVVEEHQHFAERVSRCERALL